MHLKLCEQYCYDLGVTLRSAVLQCGRYYTRHYTRGAGWSGAVGGTTLATRHAPVSTCLITR